MENRSTKRHSTLRAGLGAILAVLLTTATAQQAEDQHQHDHRPQALPVAGVLADIVVDFELVGAGGSIVADEDFRGDYVLLGFGFTRCTDVCPIMVANMARTIRAVGEGLTGAFVSVDTERDGPETVGAYAQAFGPGIVGLTGTIEQINDAARNFKISYVVTKTQSTYTVQHTSHVFLIDPDGRLVDVFAMNEDPDVIAAAMGR